MQRKLLTTLNSVLLVVTITYITRAVFVLDLFLEFSGALTYSYFIWIVCTHWMPHLLGMTTIRVLMKQCELTFRTNLTLCCLGIVQALRACSIWWAVREVRENIVEKFIREKVVMGEWVGVEKARRKTRRENLGQPVPVGTVRFMSSTAIK